MIEVAVIGAGSAGLVTARHLLANGLKCCVFEAAATLGGAWSTVPEFIPEQGSTTTTASNDGSTTTTTMTPMWKGLRTNLSKHTCRFSEFPWPEDTPTFPSQEDMDWYLKAYAKEFLLDGGKDPQCSFLYDCRVTKISPINNGIDNNNNNLSENNNNNNAEISVNVDHQKYRVEWTDSVDQTKYSKEFGGVVLATGFFSNPKYPSGLAVELRKLSHQNKDRDHDETEIEIIADRMEILHSKDYSSHEQFSEDFAKIAIVGSSHSALEIAVDLTKSAKEPITVIMPTIPWVVPRYIPSGSDSDDGFLPIDLAFYKRKEDLGKSEETTALTRDSCRTNHEKLRALLGPRQDQILPVPRSSFDQPPTVAISDLFLDLVSNGKIKVLKGRLEGLTDDGKGLRVSCQGKSNANASGEAETDTLVDEEEVVVSGVTSLICCTGYSPDLQSCCGSETDDEDGSESAPPSSISILETIQYDPTDTFSPMTTYLETLHPNLPNLAFVGMYRGPYMGVVELQARLAAEHISGKNSSLSKKDLERGISISDAIRHQDPSLRPQFPRFDYLGFLHSLTSSLSQEQQSLFPTENKSAGDIVIPAFYQADQGLAKAAQADLQKEIEKGKSGLHLPNVVTSALVGNWSFERNILHFANRGKEIAQRQYIHGKVNYSRSRDHNQVRYREDGLFDISPTKSLPVFREYDYLCTEGGALELFFVENGEMTYLFLSLKFQHQDKDGYWVATNDHLCVKDLYKANFRVKMDGLAATEVIITYRVQGPAKDYESTTVMRPIVQ